MTPDGKAIMKVFGEMTRFAPNYSSTPTANNATFQVLEPFNWRQDIVKIDYQPSGSHRIYARWIHDNYDLVNAFGTFNSSQLPNTPTARNRPGYGPQMGHTWNISPRVLNELKINTAWNGQRTPLEGENWKRSTLPRGTLCHKPCTVSGGGKSEISKSDVLLKGPILRPNGTHIVLKIWRA